MRIGVIGAGYVGLVTGACLADVGNRVSVVDIDEEKIRLLAAGRPPHYEPGLAELLAHNLRAGRLSFSTATRDAVHENEVVFIAVGTPQDATGASNLSFLERVIADIAVCMERETLIVIKSTVPIGTNRRLRKMLAGLTAVPFEIASNPEFLKEGAAIEDFNQPDRIIIGVTSDKAEATLRRIHTPFIRIDHPLIVTSPESAEITKYASNCMLALRISFMNEISHICGELGADIDEVRVGVGLDSRIGPSCLYPGLGYGGSCFPKDVRSLAATAESIGLQAPICRAIDQINVAQAGYFARSMECEFGLQDWSGRRLAVWGLAFKPQTDDLREAPALRIVRACLEKGAAVVAFDPEAMDNARAEFGDAVAFAESKDAALDGADALIICTEWNEFRNPDFAGMRARMRVPLIFDGRNLFSPDAMREHRFTYYSVGRPAVKP